MTTPQDAGQGRIAYRDSRSASLRRAPSADIRMFPEKRADKDPREL